MDLLIRRIEGTLGRGSLEGEPITADEIRDARFRTKLGGYNEVAVDFALEAFIVAVETRQTAQVAREPAGWERGAVGREPERWDRGVIERDPGREGRDPESGGCPDPGGAPESGEYPEPGEHPDPVGYARDEEPPEVFGPGDVEEHAARIERVAFRPGRLGMGYREEEVDAFLDRVVATLRGTTDRPLSAGDVREARFATVMLRPGYAVAEVDEFLADLAGVMETRIGR
ncbi:DivIVA domain-containing protein [Streptosporangium sp. DT93]|uniref:DivIVA domain-containing protein n=1 Tax=Streptosporangium sp. DT93 TaxID=3393428 RepID=UPI003CF4DF9E